MSERIERERPPKDGGTAHTGGSGSDFTHALIDFGGEVCTATDPSCTERVVRELCDYYEHQIDGIASSPELWMEDES